MGLRAQATAITLLIGVGMATLLVAVNRLALVLRVGGEFAVAGAALLTVLVEALLFAIVWTLVREVLLARRERDEDGRPIPAILTGLLSLYIVVAWLFLAPTLSRGGRLLGIGLLADGYAEPESQIFRAAMILAFVLLSFYYLVWRYRARTVARWLWEWYQRMVGRGGGG